MLGSRILKFEGVSVKWSWTFIVGLSLLSQGVANASEKRDLRLPDEYELAGSSALGILNTGAAGASGVNAIQVNPALLVLNREYSVTASYHWPTEGRDLYRIGVVDGTTSRYAAAASVVGFQGDAEDSLAILGRDSRVLRRASLGVAYPFKWFALGGSLNYVEGLEPALGYQTVKDGLSLGVGAVAFLARSLKLGISAQNLNNSKVENFAPKYLKAGLSWTVVEKLLSFNLDYRERDRISLIEGSLSPIPGLDLDQQELKGLDGKEKMVFVGTKATVYNLMKFAANYGRSLEEEDERAAMSASLGVYQNQYSFVYTVSRPHMDYSDLQTALTLQVFMKI